MIFDMNHPGFAQTIARVSLRRSATSMEISVVTFVDVSGVRFNPQVHNNSSRITYCQPLAFKLQSSAHDLQLLMPYLNVG